MRSSLKLSVSLLLLAVVTASTSASRNAPNLPERSRIVSYNFPGGGFAYLDVEGMECGPNRPCDSSTFRMVAGTSGSTDVSISGTYCGSSFSESGNGAVSVSMTCNYSGAAFTHHTIRYSDGSSDSVTLADN